MSKDKKKKNQTSIKKKHQNSYDGKIMVVKVKVTCVNLTCVKYLLLNVLLM